MPQATLLEELSLNALPAFQTLYVDGWIVRLSEGFTRRANSVQTLYPGDLPPDAKISYCEQVYAAANLPVVFKLVEGASPPALDALLADRGYSRDGETLVQTAPLGATPPPEGEAWAAFDGFLTPAWLEDFARLRPLNDHERSAFTRLQMQIAARTGYVRLLVGGETVGVAMGVVERGWLGIFDVMIAPRWRRQGCGRQLLLHLLAWGAGQGAAQAYLQVMTGNTPALNLYRSLGFTTAHTYWYRQRPLR